MYSNFSPDVGVIGDPRTSLDPMITIAYDSHFVHALLRVLVDLQLTGKTTY